MQTSILALAAVMAVATASPSGDVPRHNAKRCEAQEVSFHFNDTTIGTTLSCTTDVTDRSGAALLVFRDDCVDGPSVNYTVVSGDTLEKIAAEYNSGVCNIATANGLTNPDFLGLGQELIIPTDVCNPDSNSCRTEAGTATCVDASSGVASTYTIVAGDTFFLISSELGITLDSLVAANPGVDAGSLQIGQVINVPICATSTASAVPTASASAYVTRRFKKA